MTELWPWLTLAALGAYHGINPAMGWLFAVARGLQDNSRAAVIRAFAPIGLGHAISVAVIVSLVSVAQAVISLDTVRVVGAVALVVFGLYKLLAPMSHPRWVGMRVNFRDLTMWSFLMATAHGAGLMLIPVLLQLPPIGTAHAGYASHADHMAHAAAHAATVSTDPMVMMSATVGLPATDAIAVAVHTLAMFVAMAAIAVIVYEKLGLSILRRAWFNLDAVWAVALISAGVLALVLNS
jgi:hypothetical protein